MEEKEYIEQKYNGRINVPINNKICNYQLRPGIYKTYSFVDVEDKNDLYAIMIILENEIIEKIAKISNAWIVLDKIKFADDTLFRVQGLIVDGALVAINLLKIPILS